MNCPSLTPHLFALALLTSATSAVAQTTPTCPSGVPEDCLLPWPASRYLVADPGTATGYRLALPASAMPTNILGSTVDPTPWNRWDGFSAGSSGIVQLPVVVDPQQLNTYRQIPRSLLFRSRTTVWDLTTGRRVAHWAEVEEAPDADPTKTTLYVRPAARLEDNHHYAILVRPLRTVDGAIYWGTEGLGGLTPEAQARVHELEGERFIAVGWDFRTASGASAWGDLLAMRNQAAELAGEKGLGCTVTDVVESSDVDDPLWRRIEGSITVPQFLNAYGVLNRDPTGRPLANGTTELAFTAIIPRSVAEGGAPTRLVYFGHGLLTDRTEILRDFFVEQADRDGMVVVSTDLSGLTAADQNLVGMALFDLNGFEYVFSSLQQSIAGALLVPRTVGEMCAQLPEFQIGGHRLVSKRERYYYGISLGGNLGPVFAALSDDVNRFAMSVGGINYPVMIPRSILWPVLEQPYAFGYPSRIQRDLLQTMFAHRWDLVEGSAFAPHVRRQPLVGGTKRVLYQIGLHDVSTPNEGSYIGARTMRLPQAVYDAELVFGLPKYLFSSNSALVTFDFGATPLTPSTLPPVADNGVHDAVRQDLRAQAQIDAFFRPNGRVIDVCGGACR